MTCQTFFDVIQYKCFSARTPIYVGDQFYAIGYLYGPQTFFFNVAINREIQDDDFIMPFNIL